MDLILPLSISLMVVSLQVLEILNKHSDVLGDEVGLLVISVMDDVVDRLCQVKVDGTVVLGKEKVMG